MAKYTVFGQVTEGMDVVDKIARAAKWKDTVPERNLHLQNQSVTEVKVLQEPRGKSKKEPEFTRRRIRFF